LEEYDDERMLATRCDNIHLRHFKKLGKKNDSETHRYEIDWDKYFTKQVKQKIESMTGLLTKSVKIINFRTPRLQKNSTRKEMNIVRRILHQSQTNVSSALFALR
jgi:hypothetical protein